MRKKIINILLLLICFIPLFLYLYDWITLSGILHPETPVDIHNFMQGGIGGFKDFIKKFLI